jgi:serine-type D-Ala-D-Ala carboxypeptidase/endopeptidase
MSSRGRIQLLAVVFTLLLLGGAPSAGQQPAPARTPWTIPNDNDIRNLLAGRMARNGVGVVVGIIEPAGRRVFVHGKSGSRDNRPLNGDTVFQIGSVTKVFTGLLLADMVQRGEVKVDDPASKYLPPGVKMPERGRPITLIDLSKHWSALPSMPTNFSLDAQPNPVEAYSVEQLYQFLSTYELPREPGKQEYSNLGVALLGRLLARHAGMEYEELLKQRVIKPLDLKSTSITLTADQQRRLAPGYDRFLDPVETLEMRAMPASGSLRSTANDLLRFLSFNLGVNDSPLKAAMALQRTPGRSLGWGRSMLGGEEVYGHEGGKEGYRSAVVFSPSRRTGIVVLTNARTDDSPMELARYLLYGGAALPPAPAAPARPKTISLDSEKLDAYTGQYRFEPNRILLVASKRGYLLVDLKGNGVSAFYPSRKDEFFSNTSDAQIAFTRDDSGRIDGLTMRVEGRPESARRLEEATSQQPTRSVQ